MPWFNFSPIQLRDGTLCVDCPHFCEDPEEYQICSAVPKPRNRIYCAHLDQQTMKFRYIGEKNKRPLWCPLKEVKDDNK